MQFHNSKPTAADLKAASQLRRKSTGSSRTVFMGKIKTESLLTQQKEEARDFYGDEAAEYDISTKKILSL